MDERGRFMCLNKVIAEPERSASLTALRYLEAQKAGSQGDGPDQCWCASRTTCDLGAPQTALFIR